MIRICVLYNKRHKYVYLLSFFIAMTWIFYNEYIIEKYYSKVISATTLKAKSHNYIKDVNQSVKTTKELKYLLLWTPDDWIPFNLLLGGPEHFSKKNCSSTNCYITSKRDFFGKNLSKFDAIAFNGRNLNTLRHSDLPKKRWPHQKYIYFNPESPVYSPICQDFFDNYFNWTATYKLNSDIPYPYILIKNTKGDIIGPKYQMRWNEYDENEDKDLENYVIQKNKTAAWFVSNCESKSGREFVVALLEMYLKRYNLELDIYGKCGSLSCPRYAKKCWEKLRKEYLFYMALENSISEDYVTEKILSAVQYKVVPIVFGGANYSWFLPPGSYIDMRKTSPEDLAAEMYRLIREPKRYQRMFRSIKHYTYYNPLSKENVCAVCDALNSPKFNDYSTYTNIRGWWNPDFKKICPSVVDAGWRGYLNFILKYL